MVPGVKSTVCVARGQPGNRLHREDQCSKGRAERPAVDQSSRQMVLTDSDSERGGLPGPTPQGPLRKISVGCVCPQGRFCAATPSCEVQSRTGFELFQALAQACRCLAGAPSAPRPGARRAMTQRGGARPASYRLRRGAGGGAASAFAGRSTWDAGSGVRADCPSAGGLS